MIRIALVHPEMGVFVGHALGLCFWSKLDAAGQERAATFIDECDARVFTDMMLDAGTPPEEVSQIQLVEVDTLGDEYADIRALRAAGLGDQIGLLDPRWYIHEMGNA